MTTMTAPTDRQINFLFKLAGERVVPTLGPDSMKRMDVMKDRLESRQPSRHEVSEWIAWLLRQPKDVEDAPERRDVDEEERVTEPGVYENAEGIFVVKPNRTKTWLYAKKLVEINAERATEAGERVKIEFEYAPGAIFRLSANDKMDVERAKALTIRYGRCIVCGRKLEAAQSVERGIGPVCIKSFA